MNKIPTILFTILITACSSIAAIITGPVSNHQTGRSYYLLAESNWKEARTEAIALGGDLVVVTSTDLNRWIFDTFGGFGGVSRRLWIGLSDEVTEGQFLWVDGGSLDFAPWAPRQPDNGSGGTQEHYVHLDGPRDLFPGMWNDLPNISLATYGVVEVAGIRDSTSCLAFLASGTLLAFYRECQARRHKKSVSEA